MTLIPIYLTQGYKLRRPTYMLMIRPQFYTEPDQIPDDFDLESWRKKFEWRADGKADYVKPIPKIIEDESGDCDDFAVVAASALVKDGKDSVQFGYAYAEEALLPGHTIVYDGESVYSNGNRFHTTPEEWVKNTPYSRIELKDTEAASV